MTINGQKVEQVKIYTDSNGKKWYLWWSPGQILRDAERRVPGGMKGRMKALGGSIAGF